MLDHSGRLTVGRITFAPPRLPDLSDFPGSCANAEDLNREVSQALTRNAPESHPARLPSVSMHDGPLYPAPEAGTVRLGTLGVLRSLIRELNAEGRFEQEEAVRVAMGWKP